MVLSRMDYGNALLFGVFDFLLKRIQRVQNLEARIITRHSKRDHITSSLKSLHWLPVKSRISYKVLLYTSKGLHGLAPDYIAAPVLWNTLPENLRSFSSLSSFKKHLKTYLFKTAYS